MQQTKSEFNLQSRSAEISSKAMLYIRVQILALLNNGKLLSTRRGKERVQNFTRKISREQTTWKI